MAQAGTEAGMAGIDSLDILVAVLETQRAASTMARLGDRSEAIKGESQWTSGRLSGARAQAPRRRPDRAVRRLLHGSRG
jgi:hypothetical protein